MFDKGDLETYYTRHSKFKFYEEKIGWFEAKKTNKNILWRWWFDLARNVLECLGPWHFKNVSVQFSHSVVPDSLQPHELQHARSPCPSPTPRVHSNSRPSSRWCHPALLLLLQSPIPPSIRVYPVSQLFAWGGHSPGVSALASFLSKNTQDWSPLEGTGWISL